MPTIQDQSIYNHDGTTVGDPSAVAGYFGKGIDLDGSTQYVTTPDSVDLEVTNLTIMAWIYPRTATGNGAIFCYWSSPYGYQIKLMSDQQLLAQYGNGTEQLVYSGLGNPIALNTWTHVAYTLDGTTCKIYINGILVAEEAQTVPLGYVSGCQAVVGALSNDNGVSYNQFFDGILDELRVYSFALSVDQINAIKDQGATQAPPPPPPPPTYDPLTLDVTPDAITDQVANDSSYTTETLTANTTGGSGQLTYQWESRVGYQPYTPYAPPSPYHYWKLDETVHGTFVTDNWSTHAVDDQGNGDLRYFPHTGTGNNISVSISSLRADGEGTAWRSNTGRSVAAVSDNEATFYTNVAAPVNMGTATPCEPFSLTWGGRLSSSWINTNEFWIGTIEYYNSVSNDTYGALWGLRSLYASDTVEFVVQDNAGTVFTQNMSVGTRTSDGMSDTTNHYALTVNVNTVSLYVNDTLLSSHTIAGWDGTIATSTSACFNLGGVAGAWSSAGGDKWFDEVSFYRRELTLSEISTLSDSFSTASGSEGTVGEAVFSNPTGMTTTASYTSHSSDIIDETIICTVNDSVTAEELEDSLDIAVTFGYTDDYIAYYEFEESQYGGSAFDNLEGTSVRDMWFQNYPTYADGVDGVGLEFDGTQYGDIADEAAFRTADFSMSCWIKAPSVTTTDYIAMNGDNYNNAVLSGWDLSRDNTNALKLRLCNNTGNVLGTDYTEITTTSNVVDNTNYHHVVITYNSTAQIGRIYVNNTVSASGSWAGVTFKTSGNLITLGGQENNNMFTGDIDRVKYYNRALSSIEVDELYNAPKTPATAPDPLSVAINPASVIEMVFPNEYREFNQTAVASGGSGNYSYAWTKQSGTAGYDITAGSTTAFATMGGTGFGENFYVFKVTVTDTSSGETAEATTSHFINWGAV